jgi:hypothetical protein
LLLEDWDVPEPFLAKNAWFRHRLDSLFEEHFCAIPQKFKGRMLFSTDTGLEKRNIATQKTEPTALTLTLSQRERGL